MTQNILLTLSFLLAAAFILAPSHIEAKCNLCSEYGIACINEFNFNLCNGGIQDTTKVYPCPSNKFCSDTSSKCVDGTSGGKAACEPNKGCDVCDGEKLFACTSRTTYAQCNGTEVTKNTGVCPKGLTCNSEGSALCEDECHRPDVLECDRVSPL